MNIFKHYGFKQNHRPDAKPSKGKVLIMVVALVLVTSVCVSMAMGSNGRTLEIKAVEYSITEDNVAIIKIENKNTATKDRPLEYGLSDKPLREDESIRVTIELADDGYQNIENAKDVVDNTIKVPLDNITKKITVLPQSNVEKVLLIKDKKTGEWRLPNWFERLVSTFKIF